MHVAIIGAHWGRTHVGTFRAAGCEIIALMTRDRAEAQRVAAAEDIPVGTDDPDALDSADIIVIASPADTHAHYLERFSRHWVWCEKPLGTTSPPRHDRAFVNYAFPFLDSARTLARTDLGTVRRALVQVGVNLDTELPGPEWLREVGCHPLAWIQQQFGTLRPAAHVVRDGQLGALFHTRDALVDVALYRLPARGIRYVIEFLGDVGIGRLAGAYSPEQGWRFAPVTVDGEAIAAGEPAGVEDTEDVWYRANRRAAGAFCQLVQGRMDRASAATEGLFSLQDAMRLKVALDL